MTTPNLRRHLVRALAIPRLLGPKLVVRTLIAAAIGTGLALLLAPAPPRERVFGAVDSGVPWLALPLLAIAIAATSTAIEVWPGFGRDQEGRGGIDRLRPDPADGCLLASTCAILIASVIGAGAALAFAAARDVTLDAPLDRVRTLDLPDEGALLAPGRDPVRIALPSDPDFDRLEIRPRILAIGGSFDPAPLELRFIPGEGQGDSSRRSFRVARNGRPLRLRRPEGATALEIERGPGRGLVAVLEREQAQAFAASQTPRRRLWLLAGLATGMTTWLGTAVATLLRRRAGLEVLAFTAIGSLLVVSATPWSPIDPGLDAAARDRLPPPSEVAGTVFWSLSASLLSMIAACTPWFRRST